MRRMLMLAMAVCLVGCVFGGRVEESFNGGWRFAKGDLEGVEAIGFDDSGWEAVRVPHDWAITGPFDAKENGYAGKLPWRGVGWYRKSFELSKANAGKRVYFDFDGVMAFPKVYVNGKLAGEWDFGYMSFRVDATDFVKFGETNVIAVQADTRRHGTRWYPGAGIYRKVRMAVCEPVHVGHWGVFVTTPVVADAEAEVRVRTTLENHGKSRERVAAETTVVDPDGREVARSERSGVIDSDGKCTLDELLKVKKPKRWDIETPRLYKAVTVIRQGEKVVDRVETKFGIRTFEFTADDGFHLNGRRVQLYGVNLHHDHGPLGAAFYRRAMERQLEIMREMGCNSIRTSHNPPSPELLELCDEMGIVVWDECFDKWNATSDRVGQADLVEHNKRQLKNFVMRDRNHPSVMVWSIGNEIADIESNRSGHAGEQVKTLGDFVCGLDATRPVGMGCFIPSAVGTRVLESLDLTGWNYSRRYAPYRELFPEKPIVYSESASALSTRGFYELPLPENKTDYSKDLQVDSYDHNSARWSDIADVEFQLMEDDGFVAGEFVWTGFDYLGEPTPFSQEARSSYFGIVDLCGIPKDRFYLYRSYWRDEAKTIHILPHWNWDDRVGKNVPVYVYTNGDSAELFLNGKSLGRRKKTSEISKAVNFAEGKSAKASSEELDKGNNANGANDGKGGTRWCASDGSPGQWWQVDLGEDRSIGYIEVQFEKAARNYLYTIKVSRDGSTWREVVRKNKRGDEANQPGHELDARGRYVRIEFTDLRMGVWASISEFGVYAEKTESSYYAVMDKYRLRWMDVVYEPGELKAVAYKGGKKIGESVMRTAGAAAAIRLTADRVELSASGEDLCYVLVEAVDSKGTVCALAENMVHFEVEGCGEIAGVGHGNPLSLEPFVADYRKLFYGKAMVIVRAKEGDGGVIRVVGRSEGLREGRALLEVQKEGAECFFVFFVFGLDGLGVNLVVLSYR